VRAKQFERLAKSYLLPHLPGYRGVQALIYYEDVSHLLRGFYFEKSSDPNSFYLSVFVQPLFIPLDHVSLSFGDRLAHMAEGADHHWELDGDETVVMDQILEQIRTVGIPFLAQFGSLKDFPRALRRNMKVRHSAHLDEAICYSHVLTDDHARARTELARLRLEVTKALVNQPKRTWLAEIAARADEVEACLGRSPHSAKELLQTWADFTRGELEIG